MNSLLYQLILLITYLIHPYFSMRFSLKKTLMSNDITSNEVSPVLFNIPYLLPTIDLCFGTKKSQCFTLGLGTSVESVVLESSSSQEKHFNKQFIETVSPTYDNKTSNTIISFRLLQVNIFHVLGRVVFDYIHFPNRAIATQKKFTFLVFSSFEEFDPINLDGVLGLKKCIYEPYSVRNTSSFLNYLYEINVIKEKVFALRYNRDGSGLFIIGEDYEIKKDSYSICNSSIINDNQKQWDCTLNMIKIGTETIILLAKEIIFDSIRNSISAPHEEGSVLLNYVRSLFGYNKTEGTEGKCRLQKESPPINTIMICDDDIVISSIPDLHFLMQDMDLIVKWSDLLKMTTINNTNVYVSLLFINHKIEEKKQEVWILGLPGFYDKTIMFNKTANVIGISVHVQSSDEKIILYCFNMFMLLLGVVLIIVLFIIFKK